MSWFLNSKLVSIHADDSIVCSISFSTDVGKINIHILIMYGINYFDINYSLLEFAHIYSCKMATVIGLLYALVRFPFQPLFRKMRIFFILTILMFIRCWIEHLFFLKIQFWAILERQLEIWFCKQVILEKF